MTRTEIAFAGASPWIVAAAGAVLAAGVVLLYRRERTLVPPRAARAVTALRLAVVLLLLALFLEPEVRHIEGRVEPGTVLIVLDGSRSMGLADPFRPAWQKAREAVAVGAIDRSAREDGPERAAAALPDLAAAAITPVDWDRIRMWGGARGIPETELVAARGELAERRASAEAEAPPPAPGAGQEQPGPGREALRRSLESLQRRLDAALLGSLDPSARERVAALDRMGRLDLALAALSAPGPNWEDSPLAALSRRFRVAAVELLAEPREIALAKQGGIGAALPDGPVTDLGRPVAAEAARRSRETLAAVVLVTDGRHHGGRPPDEAMASLSGMGVPLFALAVGAEEPPRDVRIAEVDATGKVYAGDEVRLDVAIEANGMGPLSLPLKVTEGGATLAEATVEVPAAGGTVHAAVSFPAPAGSSGPRKLTVSFPPQPGEATASNDARDVPVIVLAEKARVLLIDGGPRWEYRYLKAALERDANVRLEAFTVTPPPDRRLPAGFPREREALFEHDVLILGDVEPAVFSAEELATVRDLVEARGAGLVLLSGEHRMPDGWRETPLADLLPVQLRDPRPAAGEAAALVRGGFVPRLTTEGERSPITRLVPGREPNRDLWATLPPQDWFASVASARPGAEVLVSLPEELARRLAGEEGAIRDGGDEAAGDTALGPLLVTFAHGAGRVLWSGLDSTWRWRYLAGDRHFVRFWGQVVRWAASERLPPGDDHVRIAVDEPKYESPARVSVRALVTGIDGKPLERGTVDAVVRHAATGRTERARLVSAPGSGGLYRGTVEVEAGPGGAGLGEERVTLDVLELPGYSSRPDRASTAFVLEEAPSAEMGDLTRDTALLEAMARRAAPGGRVLPLDRARELPALIPERSLRREEVRSTGVWSLAWPILGLLALLLTAEWVLRKKFDLL